MKFNISKRKESRSNEFPDGIRIVIDERRLTAANVEQLRQIFTPLVAGQQYVVLQLSQLGFIDSSGLGLLVGLRNAMLPPQKLVLEGMKDPTLVELFKLTRMDQVFTIV